MTDPEDSSVSSGTRPPKEQWFTFAFQLPLWADIQHESDEELLRRYKSGVRPICSQDPGQPCRAFRVASDAVMKLSQTGDCEVNAMAFVATKTTVPVPSLLRVIHSKKSPPGWRHIIVRYIPGRTLEEGWPSLSWWRTAIVLWTIRCYVWQFRKIPLENRPPGPIGDGPQVCNGPAFTESYVRALPPLLRVDRG